jgi:hypothetical protein
MKKLYFIALLSTIILCGCGSDFEKFNDDTLASAVNDKHIDQKEYESLLTLINISDDKRFQQFKDDKGKIDNAKVISYLLKYLKAKKNELITADSWQPD